LKTSSPLPRVGLPSRLRRVWATAWVVLAGLLVADQTGAVAATEGAARPGVATADAAQRPRGLPDLPAPIAAALAHARIGPEAVFLWVGPTSPGPARLTHQAELPANPASLIKLVTSAAALDLLGPLYTWSTPVYVDGPISQGVLHGSLLLRGRGDPRLVSERLWLLLQRVQQLGVREISGDIVIDRSAFELPEIDPGAFDGERHRPYNVQPDAFLVNGKTVTLSFHPDPALGLVRLGAEPLLSGVDIPTSVPLLRSGDCGDWRSALQADFSQPDRVRFAGRFALSCGDKAWPVAYVEPASFNARAIAAMWRQMGGKLAGKVREGRVPPGLTPVLDFISPTLPEVVRDMNKYSNNLIAQQIFLTLSLAQQGVGRYEASRELVQTRLRERAACGSDELQIDKGSGLSRQERISAACLARLLQWAWASPWMPELLASLPIAGQETTARRASGAAGRAHLKTGSLNNVAALAGVVDLANGQRQIVVALINHPLAGSDEARAALDAVLRWTLDDKDTRP
jgi:D-alanyl-D-alanine carboxypeptidase/D-alanyl-D-alanine-endopeptidase (penicillin-binding protein 4)